ncbi:MAG: hypothetical protein ACREUH_07510 [Burkholderiales bacterium]
MGYVPVLFLVAMVAAGSVQAAGFGLRAGTTGVGADLAWDIAPTLSARVGYSALKWNHDVETSTVDYDGKLKLSNLNGMVDFHPLGPVFRITGGVILNDNKYDVRGLNGGLTGTVKPERSAAPYIGIGWGTVAGTGINFYADLGVMFMGSPKANLRANCSPSAQCTALQNQVAAEEARLEDELKDFKYYPVLNLGLTIGF